MAASADVNVPSGAILTAVKMVVALGSGEDEPSQAFADEVTTLAGIWGIPALMQAFGLLIGVAMSSVTPESGEPDRLHHILPAVLTRLRRTQLAEPVLAT